MERVRARAVFVSERAATHPVSGGRALRLQAGIEASEKEVLDQVSFDRKLHALPWTRLERRGRFKDSFDARTVFIDNVMENGGEFPGRYRWSQLRSARQEWTTYGVLCQTAYEIQTVIGCGYDCSYCPYTSHVLIASDLEVFVDRLETIFEARPRQEIYKLNNRSDTLVFEPEYGLSAMLVETFARRTGPNGPMLMIYSKSANVDHLLDLEHRGRTIACFTLSTPTTARHMEPHAPPFEARLHAARRCQEAGYPVRFRFSPIVPFAGWQEEIEATVARISEVVDPELITLWTLSMVDFDDLDDIVAPSLLEPAALEIARAEATRGNSAGMEKGTPFPESLRSEIYRVVSTAIARHCPETRVSVCLETPRVLRSVEPYLAVLGGQQVCNCGPNCTPTRLQHARPASSPQERALRLPGTGPRETGTSPSRKEPG